MRSRIVNFVMVGPGGSNKHSRVFTDADIYELSNIGCDLLWETVKLRFTEDMVCDKKRDLRTG